VRLEYLRTRRCSRSGNTTAPSMAAHVSEPGRSCQSLRWPGYIGTDYATGRLLLIGNNPPRLQFKWVFDAGDQPASCQGRRFELRASGPAAHGSVPTGPRTCVSGCASRKWHPRFLDHRASLRFRLDATGVCNGSRSATHETRPSLSRPPGVNATKLLDGCSSRAFPLWKLRSS